jgi:hypothetical protein
LIGYKHPKHRAKFCTNFYRAKSCHPIDATSTNGIFRQSSFSPLPLDLELLGELAEKLPSGLFEQPTTTWRKQSESLARGEKENRLLRLMRVEKYVPAGERLIDEQLELLEQEPGVSEVESERAQLQLPLKWPKQRSARQSLPAERPRIEQLIACSAQECVCV